jgi:adenine phosphoribosyltransferase
MDLTPFIRNIPDFPKPGIQFKDITPLLADPCAFAHCIDLFAVRYRGEPIDVVAAAEARGFLFAAPLALALQRPFVPLRKPGKLPYRTLFSKYDLEYGTAELHVHADAIPTGKRVLLVDDLLATGGTMQAAVDLVGQAGGMVAGIAFVIELGFLKGREKLRPAEVFSLLTY